MPPRPTSVDRRLPGSPLGPFAEFLAIAVLSVGLGAGMIPAIVTSREWRTHPSERDGVATAGSSVVGGLFSVSPTASPALGRHGYVSLSAKVGRRDRTPSSDKAVPSNISATALWPSAAFEPLWELP
jgi:hypothetical protein